MWYAAQPVLINSPMGSPLLSPAHPDNMWHHHDAIAEVARTQGSRNSKFLHSLHSNAEQSESKSKGAAASQPSALPMSAGSEHNQNNEEFHAGGCTCGGAAGSRHASSALTCIYSFWPAESQLIGHCCCQDLRDARGPLCSGSHLKRLAICVLHGYNLLPAMLLDGAIVADT